MPVRASVVRSQMIRAQQMRAIARMNTMINTARTQQRQAQAQAVASSLANRPVVNLQVQNPASSRVVLQQRLLNEMQQQQAAQKEIENAALDDAVETHHLQRRKAYIRIRRSLIRNLWRRGLSNPISDPRGNVFVQSKLNVNSGIQMAAFSNEAMQQPPSNLQNSSNVQPLPPVLENQCPALPVTQGFQNTFNINGRSDINQWVYIPVKVIYQRPPTFHRYRSFPIVNGEMEAEDIYSPASNGAAMPNALRMGKPASYSHCNQHETGAGKVYITSRGLNYMGTYKEYTVVDQRLTISIATAYVAVKSPRFGASEVFMNAYDACGRVCEPFCKMADAPGFQRCSGALRVTSTSPALYGTNYGDAVAHLWQFHGSGLCPSMQEQNIYIQFHCNFKNSWPFGMRSSAGPPGHNNTAAPIDEAEEPEVTPSSGSQQTANTVQGQPMGEQI